MAQEEKLGDSSVGQKLAARAESYRDSVERVLREVGEHPLYEFKRSCPLGGAEQRTELVKDIQSIATSHIETEKYLVIGADATQRRIVGVDNSGELDEAAIRQLLSKHLEPAPEVEIMHLRSAEGLQFVLVVIPRQKTRRIVARVTVENATELKPRILLRQGDIWTKSAGLVGSTAKRLATAQDLDEIHAEWIEREVETRTRLRTAHLLEGRVAEERARLLAAPGALSPIPFGGTDDDYIANIEHLLLSRDDRRLRLLLEGLRDELVESWHRIDGYRREKPELLNQPSSFIPAFLNTIKEHKENIFLPALQRLTVLGLYVVKNQGPVEWFRQVVELLKEVYGTSEDLEALKLATGVGRVERLDQHLSHTLVALEALVRVHILGSYIVRRRHWEFFRSVFSIYVPESGGNQWKDVVDVVHPMAFWPLPAGRGEPRSLAYRAGRINVCAERAGQDSATLAFFGSEQSLRDALCEWEFCLEFNSFLAVSEQDSPQTAQSVKTRCGNIDFGFWPSVVAFSYEPVGKLAREMYLEILSGKSTILGRLIFDDQTAQAFSSANPQDVFLRFLKGLSEVQAGLFLELGKFPSWWSWPEPIGSNLKVLKKRG